MNSSELQPLYELARIAAVLRGENGCPWDREQTFESLKKYAVEEAYEVLDAIEKQNPAMICEELGDLLYQVYAHAQIAGESGMFNIDDVARGIITKLIRRHPHVFGNETAADSGAVLNRWEEIKKQEKGSGKSLLEGVPRHLPALLKAFRVQEKVARIGFDWAAVTDVEAKLDEEIAEFKQEIAAGNREAMTEEFGDILFTLVNIGRFLDIDAEEALQSANTKFMQRFAIVEDLARQSGRELKSIPPDGLEELWQQAKTQHRDRN